jgi:hypothetical protein
MLNARKRLSCERSRNRSGSHVERSALVCAPSGFTNPLAIVRGRWLALASRSRPLARGLVLVVRKRSHEHADIARPPAKDRRCPRSRGRVDSRIGSGQQNSAADPQASTGRTKDEDPAAEAADVAKQLSSPIANLVSITFQFNWQVHIAPFDSTRFLLNFQRL